MMKKNAFFLLAALPAFFATTLSFAAEGKDRKFFLEGDLGRGIPFSNSIPNANMIGLKVGFLPVSQFLLAFAYSAIGNGVSTDTDYHKFSSYGLDAQYRWPIGAFAGIDVAYMNISSASTTSVGTIDEGSTMSVGIKGGFEYRAFSNSALGIQQQLFMVPSTDANTNFIMLTMSVFLRIWF